MPCQTARMDSGSLLATLAREGEALADDATGHLDRPVAACPDWDVAQLVAHVGSIHAWVCRVVAAGGERVGRRSSEPTPDEPDALLAWYRNGLQTLVEALSVDPDTPAWTFSPSAPDNVGWWLRRQSLETSVHRWDVQAAVGSPPVGSATGGGSATSGSATDPIDTDLAVEGVDELLTDFLPGRLASGPIPALTGTLHLHTTDTLGEWWLNFDPGGLETRREHAKADTAVRGPASGLYLWLWNRLTPEAAGLEVFGRPETIDAWRLVTI